MHHQKICQSLDCYNSGNIVCEKCNIVQYCSQECQRDDLPGHIRICNMVYPQRLKLYCDLLRDEMGDGKTSYISYSVEVHIDGKPYCSSLFGNKSPITGYCAMCGLVMGYVSDANQYMDFCRDGMTMKYLLCAECKKQGRLICNNTYDDMNLCKHSTLRKILLMTYLKSMEMFPQDVIKYICQYTSAVIPCNRH